MWIIPLTHPLYSHFAPDFVESKEALNEISDPSISLPMWKSKPSSLRIFSLAWKKTYWLWGLFGRTLKPSTHDRFVEKYMELLEGIHANRLATQANRRASKIPGTFGHTLDETFARSILHGASSRMLAATLISDTAKSDSNWKKWVISLRKESLQRRKQAHHMSENAFLYLPSDEITYMGGVSKKWATPTTQEIAHPNLQLTETGRRKTGNESHSLGLADQVKQNWLTPVDQVKQNWLTPVAMDYRMVEARPPEKMIRGDGRNVLRSGGLVEQVQRPPDYPKTKQEIKNWPTVTTQDAKNNGGASQHNRNSQPLNTLVLTAGPQDPKNHSTTGKHDGQLNPEWVAQLMGTTFAATFYMPTAILW